MRKITSNVSCSLFCILAASLTLHKFQSHVNEIKIFSLPYVIHKFKKKICFECKVNALIRTNSTYHPVITLNGISKDPILATCNKFSIALGKLIRLKFMAICTLDICVVVFWLLVVGQGSYINLLRYNKQLSIQHNFSNPILHKCDKFFIFVLGVYEDREMISVKNIFKAANRYCFSAWSP